MNELPRCEGCGTELSATLLACPGCGRLIHAERLRQLAAEAEGAANPTDALIAWRAALELLPRDTRQHAVILSKIAALGREVDETPALAAKPDASLVSVPQEKENQTWLGKGAAGLGALALIAWKAKTLLVVALTKGKLLITGLAKLSTLSSMLLSISVYATAFGWRLALGLVVSIYIHEMGHVSALMRYGIKASTPLFIPGLGALIRLRQALDDPRQAARVGLAGPLWGTFAAAAAAGVWYATALPIWGAVAKLGASINLFNLLPFSTLDGGRAFHALNRSQRWLAVIALSLCWTSMAVDPMTEGLLVLLMIVGAISALGAKANAYSDQPILIYYILIALVLTYLSDLPVPKPG